MADYSVTGNPISLSRGASALIRVEFGLIQTAIATKSDVGGDTYTGTHDFTGATINVATQAAADNTTKAASTAHVFAERTNAATLTNKTLTTPVINSPTGIVKGDVGLGNVDNTSDANKPISTATQTALDLKAPIASPTFTGTVTIPSGASIDGFAPLASPALTGTPTAPTASGTTSTTQIASTAMVQAALFAYVGTNLGLPTFTIANALQNLRIKSDGSGYEWASNTPPAGATIYNALNFGGF